MAFSGKEIPSIQRGCKVPTLSKCTSCCSLYHCPFCSTSFYKPSKKCKVQTHLQLHFSRAVVHDDYTIHRCGLGCQTKLHYHCVYCSLIVFRRDNFVDHLTRCQEDPASINTLRNGTFSRLSVSYSGQFKAQIRPVQLMNMLMMQVYCTPQTKELESMIRYTLNKKTIPAVLPEHLRLPSFSSTYPTSLIPDEMFCHRCAGNVPLSDPLLITSKANIFTNTRIIHGNYFWDLCL
ncbi:hypothetical protein IRJ41_002636 [Triplophysa rosa]|uniref:Uncharacterized protein n=1 Tax=Triplophysa rosa TaxID=992332 RepID=A0A9W7X0N3_TRIRA|nr:hypothetical protein IRJ41_002636 [Triplophysa rosa]